MTKTEDILFYLHYNPGSSRGKIDAEAGINVSSATIKRLLADMVNSGLIYVNGQGRATVYNITPQATLLLPFNIKDYFAEDIDERTIQNGFNFLLLDEYLPTIHLFSADELQRLNTLQDVFKGNFSSLSSSIYNKEMERLGIDLSWKSSQIEGNTYSLLETELLLKEKEEAQGKSKEEAIMLLNHKDALRFVLDEPAYLRTIYVKKIEKIHTILTKNLNVERHIRTHRIGITGTNYQPLDNEFLIEEAMDKCCELINSKVNVFEKALLALLLLSYIQPFADGNKRTARIVSNAILIANGYCPLSFRTVSSITYKEAMLIFYEQNSVQTFKNIFIEQFEFAVNTYF